MSRIEVMGCPVDSYNMDQTIVEVEKSIHNKSMCQHVVVNVSKFVEMQSDSKLKEIIASCDIINADGMPIVWASWLLGVPLPERVAGVDLFQELIRVCSEKEYRPFFFGAHEGVVKGVVESFQAKYPTLDVAGYRNGYYSEDEEAAIAGMIKESKADMLFVGFSSPMKEKFLNKWMPVMNVPFCMGVGGSFDIVAGKTKRAPVWMQKTGMEWSYRIIQEPRRMWRRYARTNPAFMWMVMKEMVGHDHNNNR
ncbi:WecB/TagA/CpsF family glycosyltransferase [Desulfoluna spongiiphila]|uniref:WecB/TagA/CpsF family glycosyltransferase n=1 Tax=Desulfoluna spongiiphila TaxID=419481 RepID=UPI0012587C59|nr:WecB/TagA/CpsF family glycosyltransferase [Desulfoluna spongiiphila]VVS95308.1 glycosyl transferase wecb/taga/cpsf [Desulfoluna spongiiphila]